MKLFKEAGMTTTTQYGLRNAAILDSGATIHIFNEIARFRNYRAAEPGDVIIIGQGHVPVLGYGDVQVQVTRWDNGSSILRLRDVAHCADFAMLRLAPQARLATLSTKALLPTAATTFRG